MTFIYNVYDQLAATGFADTLTQQRRSAVFALQYCISHTSSWHHECEARRHKCESKSCSPSIVLVMYEQIPDHPLKAHLSQHCGVHGLQYVFHSWPIQRVFTWVAKEDSPSFIQQKVPTHLEKKNTLKLQVSVISILAQMNQCLMCEGLEAEPLLLCVKRNQMRWF